jgi:Ca2+/H+ antiporter
MENQRPPLEPVNDAKADHLEPQGSVLELAKLPEIPKGQDLIAQILTHALRMMGLSLTISGIFRAAQSIEKRSLPTDNLMGIVAIAFAVSWLVAYQSQRQRDTARRGIYERGAGVIFFFGLAMVVIAAVLVIFEWI